MKKFEIRELVLIALIVATILILGYVLLPFMQMMPLPAYRALIVAPIYGAGVTIVLGKVKKIGTITLLGGLIGLLLSTFLIWMVLIAFLGGALTDITCGVLFKGYRNKKSVAVAAGLFPAYQLPITFLVMAYALGGVSGEWIKKPLIMIGPAIITFMLGYFTSKGVQKFWREGKSYKV